MQRSLSAALIILAAVAPLQEAKAAEQTKHGHHRAKPAEATQAGAGEQEKSALIREAQELEREGKIQAAEALWIKVLRINEATLGPEHPNTATSLNNLALLNHNQGRYNQAEPLYKRSLAIHEKVLGPEHPDTATSLNNLAVLYYNQGRYNQAEPLYKRSLAIREKVLGPHHPDTDNSLNNLAYLYYNRCRYGEAEPLLKRSLARRSLHIRARALGRNNRDTTKTLSMPSAIYRRQLLAAPNINTRAEAKAICEAELPAQDESLEAEILIAKRGEHEKAEALLLRNIANNRAWTYASLKAHLLIELNELDRRLMEDGFIYEMESTRKNAVDIFIEQKMHDRAERLYAKSLDSSANNSANKNLNKALAKLYVGYRLLESSDFSRTKQYNDHALSRISSFKSVSLDPEQKWSINNMLWTYNYRAMEKRNDNDNASAEFLAQQGRLLADAFGFQRESLEFRKLLLYIDYQRYFDRKYLPLKGIIGLEPKDITTIRQRVLAEADIVLPRILSIDNDDTALVDMGLLRVEQGREEEARVFFKRAEEIGSGGKSKESRTYLAQIYSENYQFKPARLIFDGDDNRKPREDDARVPFKTDRIGLDRIGATAYFYGRQNMYPQQEQFLQYALRGSEGSFGNSHPQTVLYRSSLAYLQMATGKTQLARQLAAQLVDDQFLWLTQQLPLHPQQQRAALLSGQPDALALTFALLERDRSPATLDLALRTRLNRQGLLLQIEQGQRRITAGSTALRRSSEQIANIDRSLSSNNLSADQRSALQQQRQSLEADLYRQLPSLRIEPVSITQVAAALPPRSALLEIQRYKPLLSVRNAEVQWGEPHYTALLLFLDQRILSISLGPAAPLDAAIDQALKVSAEHKKSPRPFWLKVSNLLFQPLLPHLNGVQELFLSPDGSIHTVPFAALPSPANNDQYLSDSLRLRVLTTGRDLIRLKQKPAPSTPPVVLANPDYGPPGLPWQQLPYTQREAEQIATALGTTPITGSNASSAAVLKLRSPRILHIATHGFFQPPDPTNASSDPLSRSGLAFSGANRKPLPNTDDAILTAAEATALQLNGTDIVVLSACQTGLGDLQSGEGVYGLQRALTVAGARSTLLSLWKVDDLGTALFMKTFYSNLLKGLPRADALAATQASFRNRDDQFGDEHIWAAFQLTGDWTPIAKP